MEPTILDAQLLNFDFFWNLPQISVFESDGKLYNFYKEIIGPNILKFRLMINGQIMDETDDEYREFDIINQDNGIVIDSKYTKHNPRASQHMYTTEELSSFPIKLGLNIENFDKIILEDIAKRDNKTLSISTCACTGRPFYSKYGYIYSPEDHEICNFLYSSPLSIFSNHLQNTLKRHYRRLMRNSLPAHFRQPPLGPPLDNEVLGPYICAIYNHRIPLLFGRDFDPSNPNDRLLQQILFQDHSHLKNATYRWNYGKRRKKGRTSLKKKCKKRLSNKIRINMGEKRYKNRKQAIAVAYKQVLKKYPECQKYF